MITKLTIKGYTDDPSGSGSKGEADAFTTDINPEKITLTRSVKFSEESNGNTGGDINQFKGYGKDTLKFDLILDGTGIAGDKVDVEKRIKELQEVVYNYKGSDHKPYYLIVVWGTFGFKCHMRDLVIVYNLFKSDGSPLRAKISLTFIGHNMAGSVELAANKQSPDMTHIKTVRIGDRLPLMCKDIYDSPKYYLQIAKLNGLTNFRQLQLGDQLIFPPLQKK